MHDDQPGGVPQGPQTERVIMRSFDNPVTIRELLHSSLDRLFDFMMAQRELAGVVAITPLDVPELNGNSIVLAIDFAPHEHEYEGLDDGSDWHKEHDGKDPELD